MLNTPPPLNGLPPPAFTVSFEPLGPEGHVICAIAMLLVVVNIFVNHTTDGFKNEDLKLILTKLNQPLRQFITLIISFVHFAHCKY